MSQQFEPQEPLGTADSIQSRPRHRGVRMSSNEPTDAKLIRIDRASLWAFIGLSAACACLCIMFAVLGEYMMAITLRVQAFVWASFTFVRKNWIELGYARGQWAAIMHAEEARSRGLTGDEWIASEIERATGVTLIPIHPDDLS